MRIFDPHIHMSSRTTDDYERMYSAGVRAVLEPAFWQGQPRSHPASFADYFDTLIGWEPFRAAQFGIRHHCALALNPKEANDPRLREVLQFLPRYLAKDAVVAVGEVGYDELTPAEDEVFAAQLALARAHELPVLVHTPHRDKVKGTSRSLAVVREAGLDPGRVLIDHLNEVTVAAVAQSGCWMGFSIYPDTKMSPDRMVKLLRQYGTERILVNSAADWGRSDPLLTRVTGEAMLAVGFTADDVDRVLWRNPVEFFGQSGRLDLSDTEIRSRSPRHTIVPSRRHYGAEFVPGTGFPGTGDTFAGNSILRGER
jgi:predicted metal-dependent TIM-barrel fold hydrolase